MAGNILLVAGEASSDLHAAALVDQLKARNGSLHIFGVAGPRLREKNVEVVARAESLNVVGVADWKDKWREVFGTFHRVRQAAVDRSISAAVLMDLPDFNLRLAKYLHGRGIPVIYYISPQVWAWRRYRVRTIRRFVDKMLVVLPFEKAFYARHGVQAEFVGHPLLDQLQPRMEYRSQEAISQEPRVALLPGSRTSELRHHWKLLVETCARIRAVHPKVQFRLPIAPTLDESWVRKLFSADPGIELVTEDSRNVLRWADTALVASGTAALETAIVGTPFCLFYRMSWSTAFFGRLLFRYKGFFGIPNLLHGSEVVREFLFEKATPSALSAESCRLIEDAQYRAALTEKLVQCHELLGRPGAANRVASHILEIIDNQKAPAVEFLPAYT